MLSDTPGFVLAFHDGEVSAGVDRVKEYLVGHHYGTADGLATIYYNVAGTLVQPIHTVKLDSEGDDWLYFVHSFFIDGATVPFYSFYLRIDGNA